MSLGSLTNDREDSVFAHPAAESFFFLGPGWAERLSSLSHSAGVNSKSLGKWPESISVSRSPFPESIFDIARAGGVIF